jgi:tetratricopeptide (TPR) repeat protein
MKKILLLTLLNLALLSINTFCATLTDAEIIDLFSTGKQYFNKAMEEADSNPQQSEEYYRKALMHFEKIANEGHINNGKLYYNIGNIYFRLNDIGNAILYYKKAKQYIQNDPNLQQNLEFAKSRRKDQFTESSERQIMKTLFFWHYDLSSQVRVLIFVTVFMLFWAFAIIQIFRKSAITRWGMAVFMILSILIGSSLVIDSVTIYKIRAGVILSDEVTARKGNSTSYEQSFNEPLHAGTEFTLIEKRGDWCNIKLADSRTCWVPLDSVGFVR